MYLDHAPLPKRMLESRDVNETLGSKTETFDFQSETRPRPRLWEAETETFFETLALWVTLNNLRYFSPMEMFYMALAFYISYRVDYI